ncbi:MAG: 4-phosphopantetheinyl transferase [Alphaproteobacteria bacterium]|nr:4-phosphopantetheinyl transferase [Alphaproteobacteria bacterium]
MSLVARILPPGIFAADIEDRGQVVPLHPGEEATVANAGEKRRRDFALGRACARAALAQAGVVDAVIARGEDGKPVWPTGFAGSITHTRGYAAALAARTADFIALGVDAERVGGVTDDLMPRLFDAAERDWLAGLDAARRSVMAAVLFSAKEACFKASAVGKVLAFQSIHIEVQGDALVARQPGLGDLEGRFAVLGDLVLTAFWRR